MFTLTKELKLSRKDFILIASVIASLNDRQAVAEAFAKALAATNSGFDKSRFMKACGVSV